MTSTLTSRQASTPDEWLLARYERLRVRPSSRDGNFERPAFQILGCHGADCLLDDGVCVWWSAAARWPIPVDGYDLDDDFDELGETA